MKCPRPRNTKALYINLSNCLAEGKHSIEEIKMKAQYLICIRVRTMMCVMEKSAETKALLARKNLVHYLRLIPFVNHDKVCAGKLAIEKSREAVVPPVEANVEFGIGAVKFIDARAPASPSCIRLFSDQEPISS